MTLCVCVHIDVHLRVSIFMPSKTDLRGPRLFHPPLQPFKSDPSSAKRFSLLLLDVCSACPARSAKHLLSTAFHLSQLQGSEASCA